MQVKLVNRGETGELYLEGRLDSMTSGDMDAVFQQTAERFMEIVLDFEKLAYVSSAGLRVLKRLYLTMQKKDGRLILRHANHSVMEILEMSGFIGMFTVES